jgi:hypothetical protein
MKLHIRSQGGELTVPDQKEFLVLFKRGVIAPDDLVKRDGVDRWVPVAELPWIRGMAQDDRSDNRRLLWITVALMALGLLAAIWVQANAGTIAHRAVDHPSAHAVPNR